MYLPKWTIFIWGFLDLISGETSSMNQSCTHRTTIPNRPINFLNLILKWKFNILYLADPPLVQFNNGTGFKQTLGGIIQHEPAKPEARNCKLSFIVFF